VGLPWAYPAQGCVIAWKHKRRSGPNRVCKTVIRRFNSDPRLQQLYAPLTPKCLPARVDLTTTPGFPRNGAEDMVARWASEAALFSRGARRLPNGSSPSHRAQRWCLLLVLVAAANACYSERVRLECPLFRCVQFIAPAAAFEVIQPAPDGGRLADFCAIRR